MQVENSDSKGRNVKIMQSICQDNTRKDELPGQLFDHFI